MNRVADKVALITGGGSGIGAATARIFCAEGGKVMLVDANQAGLANTQKDIRDRIPDAQVATFLADVSEADMATRAVEKTLEIFIRLDVLVNNASMRNYSAISAATPAEWAAITGVNLIGPANYCRAALPTLRKTDRSSIVSIRSRLS
jgi:2-hydroxycyclohexanecarboxyl-CoA dehydrogenase